MLNPEIVPHNRRTLSDCCTLVFIPALFTEAKKGKQPNFLPIDEEIKKMSCKNAVVAAGGWTLKIQ